MNQPFTGERFWAEGRSAQWHGPGWQSPAHQDAALRPARRRAVLTTTHPDLFAGARERARFDELKSRARMTRFGGDCYGYCLLAAGFVDLIVEAGLKPYDCGADPHHRKRRRRDHDLGRRARRQRRPHHRRRRPRAHEEALAILQGRG